MKIKNTVHKCRDVIFISKGRHMSGGKDKRRRPKSKITSEKQKEINRRQAEKKLLMLLHEYFGENGLHLVLSYRNEPENKRQARREIENFLRRLRYWYSKYGYELQYLQTTEYENKRLHHHLVINGIKEISVSDIQDKIWKNGFVRCTPFEKDGYYNELAAYLIKETSKTFNTTERVFGKRYTSSRNLVLPEPTEEIKQGTESDITDIPLTYTFEGKGYELIKGSEYIGINDYTGLVYAEYAMREIKPPPGRKICTMVDAALNRQKKILTDSKNDNAAATVAKDILDRAGYAPDDNINITKNEPVVIVNNIPRPDEE